jgi:hypothetical protein
MPSPGSPPTSTGIYGRRTGRGRARRPAPGRPPLGWGAAVAARVAACAAGRPGSPSISAFVGAGPRGPLRGGRLRRRPDVGQIVATPHAARRRGLVALGTGGIETAPCPVRCTAGWKRRRARADAQIGGAADPLVRRAVVSRVRARGDACRARARRQRRAWLLARPIGRDRCPDGGGEPSPTAS